MTVRVTFELSADLDVDSEAAERSQARSHQPGDGQAGTVQRRTRNAKIQQKITQNGLRQTRLSVVLLPTPTDPRGGFMV